VFSHLGEIDRDGYKWGRCSADSGERRGMVASDFDEGRPFVTVLPLENRKRSARAPS
jgi:hypothetical protein